MESRVIALRLRKLNIRILQHIVYLVQEQAAQFDPEAGATCPLCGQEKARIRNTARPIRSHKCQRCGLTFPSVEKKAA